MRYFKLTVRTSEMVAPALEEHLTQLGGECIISEYHALKDQLAYVNEDYVQLDWSIKKGEAKVACHLPSDQDIIGFQQRVRHFLQALEADGVPVGMARIDVEELAPFDYEQYYHTTFRPTEVGERLCVVPYFEDLDGPEPTYDGERLPLFIKPGMSFGIDGITTCQMLVMMERFIAGGERVLDCGCGSGILAIGAVTLGASFAEGFDIDEVCIEDSRYNAGLNGVASSTHFHLGSIESLPDSNEFDMAVINIIAEIAVTILPHLKGILKPGAWVCIGGIIGEREELVRRHLDNLGVHIDERLVTEEWIALTGRFQSP